MKGAFQKLEYILQTLVYILHCLGLYAPECILINLYIMFNIFALVKLKFNFHNSAHNLAIETGRFGNNPTPMADRICPFCHSLNITATKDEIFFLMVCPHYQNAR